MTILMEATCGCLRPFRLPAEHISLRTGPSQIIEFRNKGGRCLEVVFLVVGHDSEKGKEELRMAAFQLLLFPNRACKHVHLQASVAVARLCPLTNTVCINNFYFTLSPLLWYLPHDTGLILSMTAQGGQLLLVKCLLTSLIQEPLSVLG